MRYGVDRVILAVVGLLVVGFVVWGVLQPDAVLAVSSAALDWVMVHAGWLFVLLAIGMVVFLLVLAFSRYGEIPLGLDGEKPEYSTASWSAMLFAAGIGIGIAGFAQRAQALHVPAHGDCLALDIGHGAGALFGRKPLAFGARPAFGGGSRRRSGGHGHPCFKYAKARPTCADRAGLAVTPVHPWNDAAA